MREKYKQELSGPIAVVIREAKTDSDHRNRRGWTCLGRTAQRLDFQKPWETPMLPWKILSSILLLIYTMGKKSSTLRSIFIDNRLFPWGATLLHRVKLSRSLIYIKLYIYNILLTRTWNLIASALVSLFHWNTHTRLHRWGFWKYCTSVNKLYHLISFYYFHKKFCVLL